MENNEDRAATEIGRAWLHYVDRFASDVAFHRRRLQGDLVGIQRKYQETSDLKTAMDNAAGAMNALFNSASIVKPWGRPELKAAAVEEIRAFDLLLADAEEKPDTTKYF